MMKNILPNYIINAANIIEKELFIARELFLENLRKICITPYFST